MSVRKRRQERDVSSTSQIPNTALVADEKSQSMDWYRRQPVWLVLAVGSGICAAINGVFAKLTTTALTASFAAHLALALGLAKDDRFINLALRGIFLGLNVVFNIAMWSLFTAALTRASSTTKVSIINVSSNFFVTAILGALVFSEGLPPMWWAGASLLAVGNIVIDRRDDDAKPAVEESSIEESEALLTTQNNKRDESDEA